MRVEQIAVFLENKSGRLAEITSILADNGINIRALSVADTADFGILRLIVDKVELAKKVLKENGFTVGKTNVLAVEVPDRTGGLAGGLEEHRSRRTQRRIHVRLCQQERRERRADLSLRRDGQGHRVAAEGRFHHPERRADLRIIALCKMMRSW